VVFFAQEEAGRLGENYVSTEHLLLGLVRENDSVAARILDRLGVSLGRVRSEIERQVVRGDGRPGQDMQLTSRAKRVIDLAFDEARQLNNNYIGTEHLLLGLIREGEGLAGRVLNKLGVDPERTRREVIRLQEAEPGEIPTTPKAETTERVDRPQYLPGLLGTAKNDDGRDYIEVALDTATFLQLIDVFQAKDSFGYRALLQGDQTMFAIPVGTPLKILVVPADGAVVGEKIGFYVRVLGGHYAGYAGWIFRDYFETVGPDHAVFPPPIDPPAVDGGGAEEVGQAGQGE
ncbi:MAG: Clp protease N-terminal domain-containing protein, partial [Capsulimonadales bacterium]|nr:Clp protease N-terminal domain-containing protein [Capsulimonadales bacterium]